MHETVNAVLVICNVTEDATLTSNHSWYPNQVPGSAPDENVLASYS